MSIQRMTLFVDGMTCPACESRIAGSLLSIDGVSRAEAHLRGGKVFVDYDDGRTDRHALESAIESAGYAVRSKKNAGTAIALGIGIVLIGAYLAANSSGVFNALPKVDASIGYAMLFIVGLLTSIHCVAMCGGIALSQSVRQLDQSTGTASGSRLRQLVPGLLYNGGRVLSYTVIGGMAGALGSAFSFSPSLKGMIAGLAGVLMVILGLRMLGIIKGMPWLANLVPSRLRAIGARMASGLRNRGPFAVGILNGLMPCGPLQTMQLYALGTGSMLAGALSMFIFSLGTVPLMLLFSLTAALLPRRFVPVMVKASAVLVMFLGVATMGRAAALSGISLPGLPSFPSSAGLGSKRLPGLNASTPVALRSESLKALLADGVQTIVTDFKDGYYVPFVVQAGVPLRWTIRIKAEDINGCNNPMVIPTYGIKKVLVAGDNLVEFTPKQEGTISYSCWMGMITSKITVVPELGNVAASDIGSRLLPGSADQGGGSCCSGSTDASFAEGRVPVDTIGMPVIKDGIQEITIAVNAGGYSPAAIILQKGMKAILRFKPDSLTSCNNPVVFPEFNGTLDLSKGELATPALLVDTDFTFKCWMGMVNGYVKVVDDISKIDIDKIRAEIGNYRGASGGCGGSGLVAKK